MKKQQWKKKATLAGLAVALSATWLAAVPSPAAAAGDGSRYVPQDVGSEASRVHVYFQDLTIRLPLPPKLLHGTTMVPARGLLEGLGYRLSWNAETGGLVATHDERPSLAFWAGRDEAEFGGQPVSGLAEAPYIEDGLLWIPLRAAAEAAGLTVSWDERNRLAVIADPHALPRISVTTEALVNHTDAPTALLDYAKRSMKADIQLNLAGSDHYREKTMVMIAAGDLPSLLMLKEPYIMQNDLISSIAIIPGASLDAYPTLKELADHGPGSRQIAGSAVVIPRLSDPHHAPFPAIRQDWLHKLELAEPRTMDELYAVLRQFAQSDPDGNGKHDTWGLTGFTGYSGLGTLSWVEQVFTGSPERFSVQDGRIVDHAVSADATRALNWLADAYRDGLLHPEFAVMTKDQIGAQLADGKVGLAAMTIGEAASLTSDEAVWLPLSSIRADNGASPAAPWNSGGDGAYILTVMARQTPEQLLEWLNHGYEMTLRDGWAEVEGWSPADQSAVDSLFGQPDMLRHNEQLSQLPDKVREQYEAAVQQWRSVSYEGTALPEANLLWSTGQYVELHDKLQQARIKVVMGAMSLVQWDSFVKEYVQSEDYQAMMADLSALLAERGN